MSNAQIRAGDYTNKFCNDAAQKISYQSCIEMVNCGQDRGSWLVFAGGIENTETVAATLRELGINVAAVHSKLPGKENDKRINAFKRGELRGLVNNGKLTTGFDHPPIDFMGILRSTTSPGLWGQILGRGSRPSQGKANALVLDFAGNTERLGPINDLKPPKKAGEGGGCAPVRICDECGMYNRAAAKFCEDCGREFFFESKIFQTASSLELVKSNPHNEVPDIQTYNVSKVVYTLHTKKMKPPSIKVTYYCHLAVFSEYVCLEHGGGAGKMARDWWGQRFNSEPPYSTHEALKQVSFLKVPRTIDVWINKKYPEIMTMEF